MAGVSMLPVVVLIVCKTVSAGPPDQNAAFTKHENRTWAYEGSMMVCRRMEVPVFDSAEAQGADAQSFTPQRCMGTAARLGSQWDIDHAGTKNPYRTWRVACPVPIVDTRTGAVIAWKLPECGHRDTVICETDSEI